MRALFATAQQPHSRNIFLNQKILPLDKLIHQQEGIVTYKIISDTYLLGDIHTDAHDLQHYQLSLPDDLRSASSLLSLKKCIKLMLNQQC